MIRAVRRVPSLGEQATPARFEGRAPFSAYVAHELRAPIALQRALVEVALADPHADAAALRTMGERVVASCVQQQRLIEGLLDLVRSGRELTRREPIDLAAITAEALRAHDVGELESVVTLEPARTTGDPGLVERLAANLISNAIRHNLVGGRIEIATRTESGRAALLVANTGPLVPAADLRRLFQPFQRLDANPGDGLGLGLAIVEAIAATHGALVTARTRPGGGLRIGVSFSSTFDGRQPRRERLH